MTIRFALLEIAAELVAADLEMSRERVSESSDTAEGVWRTTSDGRKIFIADSGEVRAGGPEGPVISGGGQVNPRVLEWAKSEFGDPDTAQRFAEWFSDSKVVDENGDPLVVYHGSPEDFDTFDTSMDFGEDRLKAAFFSDDPAVSSGYAWHATVAAKKLDKEIADTEAEWEKTIEDIEAESGTRAPERRGPRQRWLNDLIDEGKVSEKLVAQYDKLDDRIYDLKEKRSEEREEDTRQPNVKALYLSLQNPYIVDATNVSWDYIVPHLLTTVDRSVYDGIIWRNLSDSPDAYTLQPQSTIAVFDPKKIKSALANTGAFDPANPKITESATVEGIWRTTEDGSKIFIADSGEVRGGGPDGPIIKNSGDSAPSRRPWQGLSRSEMYVDEGAEEYVMKDAAAFARMIGAEGSAVEEGDAEKVIEATYLMQLQLRRQQRDVTSKNIDQHFREAKIIEQAYAARNELKREVTLRLGDAMQERMGSVKTDELAKIEDEFNEQPFAPSSLTGKVGTEGYELQHLVAKRMVDSWARDSGDSKALPVGMQLAAKELFDLRDAKTSHFGQDEYPILPRKSASEFAQDVTIRAGLQAQYEMTQEQLRRQGITEVTLYRGYRDYDAPEDVKPGVTQGRVALQPLSSFSMSPRVAGTFGFYPRADDTYIRDPERRAVGRIIRVTVPANRIFSLPSTGFGCLSEQEVVVLGGETDADILAWAK